MQQQKFLTILLVLLLTNISACSLFKPKIVTVTEFIERDIAIVQRPKSVKLNGVKFYVVVDENFEEFKKEFTKINREFVFIAISVKDYENLSLNLGELKRYIEQQKQIILYYEDALTPNDKEVINAKQ